MAADKNNIIRIGELLWGWKICAKCRVGSQCNDRSDCSDRSNRNDPGCPGRRYRSIQRYYQFCEAILRPDPLDESFNTKFIDDNDLHIQVIRNLKSNPDLSRQELRAIIQSVDRTISPTDISATIDRAVRTMLMVDCAPTQASERLEEGQSRLPWGDGIPLPQFLEGAFPKNTHHVLSSVDHPRLFKFRDDLRADRLKKMLKIEFRGTGDLRDHLRLSHTARGLVVNVFHHAGFLKEQLIMTKTTTCGDGFSQSIRVCGALPRQLVLETIDSLQSILFPVASKKARKLLDKLVVTNQWDPEAKVYELEFGSLRQGEGGLISYHYFAERLSELHNELENPSPRGWLERRLERRKADRYMMMATLAGVVFAVLLGMFALIISCFQTWISYQAWQHPVSTSG